MEPKWPERVLQGRQQRLATSRFPRMAVIQRRPGQTVRNEPATRTGAHVPAMSATPRAFARPTRSRHLPVPRRTRPPISPLPRTTGCHDTAGSFDPGQPELRQLISDPGPSTARTIRRGWRLAPPPTGKAGRQVTNTVTMAPGKARPGETSSDTEPGLACTNRTQHDALRRSRAA